VLIAFLFLIGVKRTRKRGISIMANLSWLIYHG